ncbi:hypothetical protein R0135_04715 [Congregibacter variabilis]|uniref:Uncharacterized protein n=1 Tax=Congregibacter variabilis TaxID=3081200 RepID=A0ABZ0I5H4_9GAMM|nr:hypothetical protein R0135_04715 [Congregibacter sp. IMCC43200]
MKKLNKQLAVLVAGSLLVSQGIMASDEAQTEGRWNTSQATLISDAFDSPPSSGVEMLDERAMSRTQGELWPWIIGVVTLDLSLASFFWGDYVPTVASSGGLCVNCDIGTKSR